MIRLHRLLLLLCGLWAAPAWAAGLSATLDAPDITLQQSVVLTLTVDGSQAAEPHLPELPDFEVRGYGRSSKMTMVNGRFTSSVGYNYVLTPKNAGHFTIGSATVNIDGKEYQSAPLRLTVHTEPPAAQPSAGLFITSTVDHKAPYVGQQVIFTWRFLRRERIAGAKMSLPAFDDFSVEPLGGQQDFEAIVQGQRYTVTEIRQALFPLEAGAVTIPPSSLQCDVLTGRRDPLGSPFDDFFGHGGARQTRTLRGPQLDLQVRPPPDPPANFSGLTGHVTLQAAVQHGRLRVGDSTTLTLKLSGTAHLKHAMEPSMPPLTACKTYDDKPIWEAHPGKSGLMQSKTFRKALVPGAPGRLTVGPFSVVVFDPNGETYQTVSSPAIELEVAVGEAGAASAAATPGSAEASPGSLQKIAVEVLADDILPNHRQLSAIAPGLAERLSAPFWALCFLLPVVIYGGVVGWTRAQKQGAQRRGRRRRSKAPAQAQAALRALGHGDAKAYPEAISRILRSYVGTMLEVEGLSLTPADVHSKLMGRGLSTALCDRLEQLLADCDALQYSTAPASHDALAALLQRATQLLLELDPQWR